MPIKRSLFLGLGAVLAAVGLVGADRADALGPAVITAGASVVHVYEGETATFRYESSSQTYQYSLDGQVWTQLDALGAPIEIDFNQTPVTVVFDGSGAPLVFPNGISATDGAPGSLVRMRGTVGVSGDDADISIDVPIELTGATTIVTDDLGPGIAAIDLTGEISGPQPLVIDAGPGPQGVAPYSQVTLTGGISVASLAVDTGYAFVTGVIETTGEQTWSDKTLITLQNADTTLRASRIQQSGWVSLWCPELDQITPTACATTRTLTVDVTDSAQGSTLSRFGGSAFPADTGERNLRLVKEGPGLLGFNATEYSNRYTGGTVVAGGALRIAHANGLGEPAAGAATVVDAAGELQLSGGVTIAQAIELGGSLRSVNGTNRAAGGLTLTGDAPILALGGDRLEIDTPVIAAAKDLYVEGHVNFNGPVATVGTVLVPEGATWTTDAGLIASSATLQVEGVALMPVADLAFQVGRLTGAGAIRCGISSCGTVTARVVGAPGAAFAGTFGGTTGTLGNFTLRKQGAGTLILSGANQVRGNTNVDEGELRVTGSIGLGNSVGTVTVAAGSRLSGSGEVGGTLAGDGVGLSIGGTLDLDADTGPETMTSAAVEFSNATFDVGVDSVASASQLQVVNFVHLSRSPVLRVRAGSGLRDGDVVTIVGKRHPDPVDGTFAGLAEGATVTPVEGAGTFRISYVGGDGNDITLTYRAPPSPAAPPPTVTPAAGGAGGITPTRRLAMRAPRLVRGVLVSRVTAPGRGAITQTAVLMSGRAAKAVCRARVTARKAGPMTVRCALDRSTRAKLRSSALTLRVTTTFAPTGGGAALTSTSTVRAARSR